MDCDHAGRPLTSVMVEQLRALGVAAGVLNLLGLNPVDYPDIGHHPAKRVADGECECGILISRPGLGMAMVANNVEGVFAGTGHDVYSAERLCQSNNAQTSHDRRARRRGGAGEGRCERVDLTHL